ncbi:unnamed protein product [Calypogeia fissa]
MAIEGGGGGGGSLKKSAYIRLATKADVPVIKLLIEGLAEFEKLMDRVHATEAKLEASLFRQPAFLGPTVLILEIGTPPSSPQQHSSSTTPSEDVFPEKCLEVSISTEIQDASSSSFISSKDSSRTVIGFTLFFPNYSTFLAKSGIYIEDLFVREEYRRQGLGKLLLKTVAQHAALRDLGRVEWSVLDWNVNAIKFYEAMGAIVQQEWRICRLAGDALKAYAG